MSGINPPPMLLLDEDVRPLLAEVLRQRGYDAVHVLEIDRGGYSDNDQLDYASNHGRTLLTHNIRDFLVLDQAYRSQGREHCGILLSDQVPFRELLRRTLRCLNHHSGSELRGRVEWLHRFK